MQIILKVDNCNGCPFSSWSTKPATHSTTRVYHKCNVQDLPTQYRRNRDYKCFETCPLKNSNFKIISRK